MQKNHSDEKESHLSDNKIGKITPKSTAAKWNHVRIGTISDEENNVCAEIQVPEKAVHEIAIFSGESLFIKRFIQLEAGTNLIKIPNTGLKKGIHLLTIFLDDTSSSKSFSV